jgi:AcrR family transcriptional regulator
MKDFTNNKKWSSILDTSRELFWKYGFRRVTIYEICREAKTSKMTFYRFFPNKLELARAVFDRVADEGILNFRKILKENSSPSEKVKKMLQMKLEGTNNISNEFINDFYKNPDLGLKSYIEEKTKSMGIEIIQLLKDGQDEGWIREDIKVEFLFFLLQKITNILTDEELLRLYNSPEDLIKELTNLFVYGIIPSRE